MPSPTRPEIKFWLMELRTPELLIEVAQAHVTFGRRLVPKRRLLMQAAAGKISQLERALRAEEVAERREDKVYWSSLLKELESLRHAKC